VLIRVATWSLLAPLLYLVGGTTPAATPAAQVTRSEPEVPRWLLGAWQRDWVQRGGTKSNTRAVEYLQAPTSFGDLRIPIDRPSFAHAVSFRDLSDGQLHTLMQQQGSAGHTHLDGTIATWTHEIDFQPPDGTQDVGRIERVGQRRLYEHALDNSYVESWTKSGDAVDGRLLVIRVERSGRLDRVLLVVGKRFLFVRNRVKDLPQAESLEALADSEHADRARIIEYLDCEISSGTATNGNNRLKIERSTLPWREGRPLEFVGPLRPSTIKAGMATYGTAGERWSISVNTFSEDALRALFGAD
jgi:hypothetical protein